MEDAYEELIRWYLRFNGFLCIENFIIHEPTPDAETVPQGGEIDTLAVRFPFSREVISAAQEKHVVRDELLEPPVPGLIEFVIAEVKGGDRIRLNSIWRDDARDKSRSRVEYLMRWLGCFPHEETIKNVSARLQNEIHAEHGEYSFRLILFARRGTAQGLPQGITVITFTQIMRFIVKSRANSWLQLGIGTRSRHPQWSQLMNDLWVIAGPENNESEDEKVSRMVELLQATNQLRRAETEMRQLLGKLLASPLYRFDERIRSVLPDEQGLYIVYDCSSDAFAAIRAGKTRTAAGGLRQRVYMNHLMGDQKGNLRQQLVSNGVCPDLVSAKAWIQNRCKVRFLTVADAVTRNWAEHHMLSVIRPIYCD
jgi:hypothetical protein